MLLDPCDFLRRPLPDLVGALASADPRDLPLPGDVLPHSPHITAPLALDQISTVPEDARLPDDHPDIEVPGVVLEQFLGGGGQGWVYAGRVRSTNKVVAVKVLARGADVLSWGAREALLCAKVRHRNVLRVLRAEPVGAFWVVLMELVQGDELDRGRLDPAVARTCFAQLADALAELAKVRLVHRDVKPANVLLRRPDRSPVLIDFGLAIDLAELESYPADVSGTPFFMAPEAYREEPPAPAWDAYALGVSAAVALAGPLPLSSDLMSLRKAKLSGTFERRVAAAVSDCPDTELRSWVTRMIADDPADRLAAVEAAREWALIC
ncbi:MAG: serine/threonine-protein kinase [Gemmataceae bacterium]